MNINQSEYKDTKIVIAENILKLMEINHKTRKDICKDLDIKYTTFCDWVNAKAYPRIESLEKVSDYFGVSVGDFFFDIDTAKEYSKERIMAYTMRMQEVDLDIINRLSEEQVKILLKSGVRIKHKKLEDYIKEATSGKKIASDELDWGERLEGEIW